MAPQRTPLRVVQWTTGNVGKHSVRALVENPLFELVGCFAYSDDKIGRDVGELSGIAPIGVTATNDVDALLALKPDCVMYAPKWQDVDELVRILAGGVNVVATAAFITGDWIGKERDRLAEACAQGGSTLFGTGINPGFVELVAIVAAGMCDRIDKITVIESADTTLYDSPETEIPVGFGRPIDDPELPAMTRKATGVFEDAVHLVADALGVELDEVRCETEYAMTTEPVVMESWTLEAGTVAGAIARWIGVVNGKEIIELTARWKKGHTLVPDWDFAETHVYEIAGRPTMRLTMQPSAPADFEAKTAEEWVGLGMIMTAMPAINMIPHVVDAAPGIATYNDLPIPLPRGVVRV